MSPQTPYSPPTARVDDIELANARVLTNTIKAGRLIRLLGWISLCISVVIGAAIALPTIQGGANIEPLALVPLTALFLLSAGCLIVGASIKKGRSWAKAVGGFLGVLSLFNFPVGTLIGAFVLYYLARGWNEDDAPA